MQLSFNFLYVRIRSDRIKKKVPVPNNNISRLLFKSIKITKTFSSLKAKYIKRIFLTRKDLTLKGQIFDYNLENQLF